jgi:hypothetical protein
MMADGEDLMMRPVMKGMCKYESLKDGTLDLYDILLMNEALDVESENQIRIAEARRRKNEDGHGS